MNMDRIKKALPAEEGMGRRSVIRNRPDVGEVIVDCVLRRRPFGEIAKRCGVTITTLDRFRAKFVTDEITRIVMAEAERADVDADNVVINKGQDDVQQGLRSIIKEQTEIYKLMKDKVGDGRDVEDLAPALGQLLRDQGQSFERLLKSYTALKEKTTVVLSINEAPEWAVLQEVLYATFEQHPEAFESFRALSQARKLRLEQ
jgi:hypothetical protein